MQVFGAAQYPFSYKFTSSSLVLFPPQPNSQLNDNGTTSSLSISSYSISLRFVLPIKFHFSSTCFCSSRKNNPRIERYLGGKTVGKLDSECLVDAILLENKTLNEEAQYGVVFAFIILDRFFDLDFQNLQKEHAKVQGNHPQGGAE